MVFPHGGPEPRHPSQLYEAGLEGIVLFVVLAAFAWRPRDPATAGRLGGIFLIGYAIARSVAELFREPDAHLGFLWGGAHHGPAAVAADAGGRPRAGGVELRPAAARGP